MRWSLILSTFITILSLRSLLSFALVTAQNSVALEKRIFGSSNDKIKSSSYRRNSMLHPYAYTYHPTGDVTRQKIPADQRLAYNKQKLKEGKTDADHLFEGQMYDHHVKNTLGTQHKQLPNPLKDEARRIMNGPDNVAPAPASVNRSKGQWVKAGLKGNAPQTHNPLTRSYSLATYPSARKTAQDLQHAFEQHGYGTHGPTFHDTLHNTMVTAGVLHPHAPSPPGSPAPHQHSSYHPASHPAPYYATAHASSSHHPASYYPVQHAGPSYSGYHPSQQAGPSYSGYHQSQHAGPSYSGYHPSQHAGSSYSGSHPSQHPAYYQPGPYYHPH